MSRRDPNHKHMPRPSGLPNFTPRADRKTLQLCAQVKDALHWVLGSVSERKDDVLLLCSVEAVEPLPGGNRMLVKIAVPPEVALSKVTDQLAESASALRMEVGQAITRRRVPELLFLPVHPG